MTLISTLFLLAIAATPPASQSREAAVRLTNVAYDASFQTFPYPLAVGRRGAVPLKMAPKKQFRLFPDGKGGVMLVVQGESHIQKVNLDAWAKGQSPKPWRPLPDDWRWNGEDAFALSADGSTLAHGNSGGLTVIDLRSGARKNFKDKAWLSPAWISLNASGDKAAVCFETKTKYFDDHYWDLWVTDLRSGKSRRLGHGAYANWSNSGELVAVEGGMEGGIGVKIWNGKSFRTIYAGARAEHAAFRPDGRLLIFGQRPSSNDHDRCLYVVDRKGKVVFEIKSPGDQDSGDYVIVK